MLRYEAGCLKSTGRIQALEGFDAGLLVAIHVCSLGPKLILYQSELKLHAYRPQ